MNFSELLRKGLDNGILKDRELDQVDYENWIADKVLFDLGIEDRWDAREELLKRNIIIENN